MIATLDYLCRLLRWLICSNKIAHWRAIHRRRDRVGTLEQSSGGARQGYISIWYLWNWGEITWIIFIVWTRPTLPTNSIMHQTNIPQCTMCTFLFKKGAWWDMGLVRCEICGRGGVEHHGRAFSTNVTGMAWLKLCVCVCMVISLKRVAQTPTNKISDVCRAGLFGHSRNTFSSVYQKSVISQPWYDTCAWTYSSDITSFWCSALEY